MPATEKLLLKIDAREACGANSQQAREYVRSAVIFRLLMQSEETPAVPA